MVSCGHGFAVVVADGSGDDAAIVSVEARNVAIEGEIFAVFVMAAMADHVADVVQHARRIRAARARAAADDAPAAADRKA